MAFFQQAQNGQAALENGVENVLPDSVDVPQCEGLSRRLWGTKLVTLYSDRGEPVADGICQNVSSDFVLGADGPLDDLRVAVQISKSLCVDVVPDEWRSNVVAWHIEFVYYNGYSLRDHEIHYHQKNQQSNVLESRKSSSRAYSSVLRNPSRPACIRAKVLLSEESINLVASKVCCSKNCVQLFPRYKIRAFRERTYQNTSYQFRFHMKLDVHRQVHYDADGKRVVTVEGINVCMATWRYISGVSEATFHQYQFYAVKGVQAQHHGNTGSKKTPLHSAQATATLKCILENSADHMPHRMRTLKSGEKVVSMIMPATFKWKDTIPEINRINATFGLKEVSTSNLSNIRKFIFAEYEEKKPGDNFGRCSVCDKYQSLQRTSIPGTESFMKWAKMLENHLNVARAH